MKNKILLAILLLLSTTLQAQTKKCTVSGLIKDKNTGETIVGAFISDGDGKGGISNDFGFYSTSLNAGRVTLSYQYLGYKLETTTFNLNRDTVIHVMLSQAIMQVNDVIINSGKQLVATQNSGGLSMNFQQLKFVPAFLGEQDVFKYLQLLPGVSSGKEGMSGLNIRGGSSDQTQILLDDVPIYNQSHGFGLISIFSGEAVKSAELLKGYSSPSYGGRLSGVASLRMRDGNRYQHMQSLQLGTTTISGNVEGPIKKGVGSYLVSARVFTPGLLLRAIYPIANFDIRTNYGFYDVTAKATYDLGGKNTIYFSFYSGNDNFGMTNIDTYDNYGNEKKVKLSKSSAGIKWGNSVASLRLNTAISPKLFMNNTLYYSLLSNEKYNNYEHYKEKTHSEGKLKSRMDEIGLKSNFEYTVTPNYTLTYGLNIAQQYFNPQKTWFNRNGKKSSVDYGKRNLLSAAVFVNNKYTLNHFTFNVGLRAAMYDNSDKVVSAIEPRASVSYDINQSSALWVSYVRNSQPLFSLNKYYFSIPVDYWIPFTGKKIQHSDQFTIGARKSFNDVWDITAEVYYKKSSNLSLVYNSDDFLLDEGGYDMAKGRSYGAELSVQYHKNKFSFMLSYTYSKSENNIGDKWRPYIYDAPHDVNFLAMYDVLNRGKKKHTLSLNIGYKTGLPYILSNETYPNIENVSFYQEGNSVVNYPKYANTRLTDFFRVDINYSMEKKLRKGSRIWQISMLNATAHNNPYIIYKTREKYKGMTLIPLLPSFSYKRNF